ncbi:hypothetical protein RRG08_039998 [Elysia crispata]|uniref:Uncharacterized protein n=1 Tax=Elysia crispata TaxID=231223 RepID=A0AAE1DBJ3_9GAST|nr:hypothetical protein RRG08_039998 [Elysia crispata]
MCERSISSTVAGHSQQYHFSLRRAWQSCDEEAMNTLSKITRFRHEDIPLRVACDQPPSFWPEHPRGDSPSYCPDTRYQVLFTTQVSGLNIPGEIHHPVVQVPGTLPYPSFWPEHPRGDSPSYCPKYQVLFPTQVSGLNILGEIHHPIVPGTRYQVLFTTQVSGLNILGEIHHPIVPGTRYQVLFPTQVSGLNILGEIHHPIVPGTSKHHVKTVVDLVSFLLSVTGGGGEVLGTLPQD